MMRLFTLKIKGRVYLVRTDSLEECPEYYIREKGYLDEAYLEGKEAVEYPDPESVWLWYEVEGAPDGATVFYCQHGARKRWCFIPRNELYVRCASYTSGEKQAIWVDSPAFFGGELIAKLEDAEYTDKFQALEDLSIFAITDNLTPVWLGSTFVNLFPALEFLSLPEKIFFLETEEGFVYVLIDGYVYKLDRIGAEEFSALIGRTYGWERRPEKIFEVLVRETRVDDNLKIAI